MSACLVCGSMFQVEDAHWPEAVGMGRNRKRVDLPTIPLCHKCHTMQHMGGERIIRAIGDRAPNYWQDVGAWEKARPHYERYLSRREYFKGVSNGQ